MDIDSVASAIAEDFSFLEDWEVRYEHIIALGHANKAFPEDLRTPANRVGNCASQVWLVCETDPEGRLQFRGASDAVLVSGLVSIILSLYSGQKPDSILEFDAEAFFREIGIDIALTRQRADGLRSIDERIRAHAQAASAQST